MELSKDEKNYRNMVLGKINSLAENNQETLSLEIEQDIEFAPNKLKDWLYRIFDNMAYNLYLAIVTQNALRAGYKPIMSALEAKEKLCK